MSDELPLRIARTNSASTRVGPGPALPSVSVEESCEKTQHHVAGRRKKLDPASRRSTEGTDELSLTAMGKIYSKVIGFSILIRMLVYVVPVGLLLAVPPVVLYLTGNRDGVHVSSQDSTKGPPLFDLFFWIELSWLSLWLSKCVANILPAIFMFFCGVVSSGTRKYANVIRALEIPLSLFGWALSAWLTFKALFLHSVNSGIPWVNTLQLVLGAAFTSSAIYLGEKAIVQLIAISYHQRSFANRIRESKNDMRILGILYDASRALFPMYCPEFAASDYVINDGIEIMLGGDRPSHKSNAGFATPIRFFGDVGRLGDKVTSVFGNLAAEITGKQVFNPTSAHSIVVEALEKTGPSEALAKRIWMSFAVEGRNALYAEDIREVLGPSYTAEADEAFGAIDEDQNGDISLDEMIRKVVNIGKERKAINEGIKDISEALKVFDNVLLFVVWLLVIFVFLAFFQSSFVTTLATAGTALLSLSFIFAVTTQEFLGSCIFLFVKHPYDVGDRVDITNGEKIALVVDRISLLYTIFTRIDKNLIVQVPNITLNGLWIDNITRSKAMKELVSLSVAFETSLEDIELLRLEMEKFVQSPDNSRDFHSDFTVAVSGVGNLDKLDLSIAMKHKTNWHNDVFRAARRSKFMCALALALRRIPIYAPGGGGEPLGAVGNPSYSVTVSDAIAKANREHASEDKEAKRMVSTTLPDLKEEQEEKAATVLNWRLPAATNVNDSSGSEDGTQVAQDLGRSADIKSLRHDLQHMQSGRRKPGEGLPPMAFNGRGTGLSVGQPSRHSSRFRRFDEEAQTGRPLSLSDSRSLHRTISVPAENPPHPRRHQISSDDDMVSLPPLLDTRTQPLHPMETAPALAPRHAGPQWPPHPARSQHPQSGEI